MTDQDALSFSAFDAWTQKYINAAPDYELKASLEDEGAALALQRRAALARLIESDPQQALAQAVPFSVRINLPANVQKQLEVRISAEGSLGTVISMPEKPDAPAQVKRTLTVDGTTYQAFVYGRRLQQWNARDIPVHGIAIDDRMALNENPVRVLEPAEWKDSNGAHLAAAARQICPISGNGVTSNNDLTAVAVGSRELFLCCGGHITSLNDKLTAQEGGSGTQAVPQAFPVTSVTTGVKAVLFIRVNFPDKLAEPETAAEAQTEMSSVSTWFSQNSYGKTSMTTTVTPLLTLPKTEAAYIALSNGDITLLADARAVAQSAGYDYTTYDLDAVRYNGGPGSFSGQAYVDWRGVWLKSSNVGVACHEFGHNYGLWHANYWNTTDGTSIGAGSNAEYGDSFDTMGSASSGGHFNAYEKNRLSWLPDSNVTTVTASGQYRVVTFDQPNLSAGSSYALKFAKDSSRDYWVDFRQLFTANTWEMNGVELHWSAWANSNGGGQLLDTTPGSVDGKQDSAILLGRTFADSAAGVFITPVAKGGTSPESMDVVVNLGSFPDNLPPAVSITSVRNGTTLTFTANASDPNGDALAYFWNFGDKTFGTNSATVTKSWSVNGTYTVTCTVSDMKGGSASASVSVNTGQSVASVIVTPSSASVTSNGLLQFTATASDLNGQTLSPQPVFDWTVNGGGSISNGLFSAGLQTGGPFTVTATSGGRSGSALVTIVAGSSHDSPGVDPLAVIGTGTGLQGDYFEGRDLNSLILTRIDSTVDFKWGQGTPDASISTRPFSIRWSGQVLASYSQVYSFYTTGSEGVRLWINDQLLIDRWVAQGTRQYRASYPMKAGVKYNLRLEYFMSSPARSASMQLKWSGARTPRQDIPQSQLYPPPAGFARAQDGSVAIDGYQITPAPARKNKLVQVSASASSETGTPLTYTWNFGDGSTADGASAIHTYAAKGAYTVTLTITDGVTTIVRSAYVPVSQGPRS